MTKSNLAVYQKIIYSSLICLGMKGWFDIRKYCHFLHERIKGKNIHFGGEI